MRHLTLFALLLSAPAWAEPPATAPETPVAAPAPAAPDPALFCATIEGWEKTACAGQVQAAKLLFELAKAQLTTAVDCAPLDVAERPACEAKLARLKLVRAEARVVAGIETPAAPTRTNTNRMEGESDDE